MGGTGGIRWGKASATPTRAATTMMGASSDSVICLGNGDSGFPREVDV